MEFWTGVIIPKFPLIFQKQLTMILVGNMIDVCPVGALTDRTFRFKNRVWFTKPMDAHRDCAKCCGKVTLVEPWR